MEDIRNEHGEIDKSNAEQKDTASVVDIRKLYEFKPEDLVVELSGTFYSNISYLQIAPRDVIIDFLEMPGIKKDGKVVIGGIRIYLSHIGALKMVESLGALLENNADKIERFELYRSNNSYPSTEISSPSEK
ncbi:MAG: hypothetical protein JW986_05850 [Methanotrichaceae archaeon]|nr:hypothetical protein [Methanotrichaceae archaeon]